MYPTSGLTVEPNDLLAVPIKIIKVSDAREQGCIWIHFIQFFPELEMKITSRFGSFGISESMDQRVLALSGTTHEINEKLNNLRYKNQMFDTRRYTDLVTLWIKGFPALHFEVQIRREQLEVLQVKSLYNYTLDFQYGKNCHIFTNNFVPSIVTAVLPNVFDFGFCLIDFHLSVYL